jgi:hypothetical protein
LQIEQLEDRCVPTVWGKPWPDASHLTLSFVPDGTPLGNGQTSDLFAKLNAIAPTAVWQREVLQAYQTWAATSNINIGVVSDDGEALGTPGRPQGDPRFGDIRIAAGAFSNTILAFTQPYDPTAGTWGGDMRINSTMPLGDGTKGTYDLETVLVHEAGHSFGLGDNTDPTSVMDGVYQGINTTLGASDISSLQALYGARQADASNNSTPATATQLSLLGNANGVLSIGVSGDLSTQTDVDYYRFSAPSLTAGLTITLQRAGLSTLTPRVTVYNWAGQVVGSAVSTDPLGGDLTIQVNGVIPLGTYYVEVQGASGTAFDVGSYNLNIQSLPVVNGLLGLLGSTVSSTAQTVTQNDLELNGSFLTAQNLSFQLFGPTAPAHLVHQASISYHGDVDYFQVQAPPASTGDTVLTVVIWPTGSSTLLPTLSLYDANENQLNADILSNEGGALTLQVTGVTPGASYYLKVGSAVQSGTGSTGGYTFAVDFGSHATQMQTFVNSTQTAQAPSQSATLVVKQTQLFHFTLSADANDGSGETLAILDRHGNVVASLSAVAGQTTSLTLTLNPGSYTFLFTAVRSDGKPITYVDYVLRGIVLSDPEGPQPVDPTAPPPNQSTNNPSSPSSTAYSGSTGPSSDPYGTSYQWYGGSTGPTDPSNPPTTT